MEFGKHLKKGFWGFADKSLPAIYGLGFVFLVIRVLPKEEFGTYVLIQNLFLLLVAAGSSFALQPMVKYAAETEEISEIVTTGNWMYVSFVVIFGALIAVLKEQFAQLFHSPSFSLLAWFLPLMLILSSLRTVILYLFQSKIQIKQMFWINAVYFLGSLLLIAFAFQNIANQTAFTILLINTITLALSSLLAIVIVPFSFRKGILKSLFQLSIEKETAKKFWHYGKYSFGASATYTLYTQADSFILATVLGPISVAVYNAAKIFTRVFDVVLQVIITFLMPTSSKLSAQNNSSELLALAEKSMFVFTVLVFPVALFFWFFAPQIISLLYVDKYPEAIPVLRILAVAGICIPTIGVASSFLYGIGKMKEVFVASTINVFVAIALFYLGILFSGIIGGAISIVLTSVLMMFTYSFTLVRFGKVQVKLVNVVLRYKDAVSFSKKIFSKE
ncbi:MAG: hypothetical protein FJ218_04545 [Ignavibacteria bacterium]|nr:hypothetical protein [Ignavibacteria bacterium]